MRSPARRPPRRSRCRCSGCRSTLRPTREGRKGWGGGVGVLGVRRRPPAAARALPAPPGGRSGEGERAGPGFAWRRAGARGGRAQTPRAARPACYLVCSRLGPRARAGAPAPPRVGARAFTHVGRAFGSAPSLPPPRSRPSAHRPPPTLRAGRRPAAPRPTPRRPAAAPAPAARGRPWRDARRSPRPPPPAQAAAAMADPLAGHPRYVKLRSLNEVGEKGGEAGAGGAGAGARAPGRRAALGRPIRPSHGRAINRAPGAGAAGPGAAPRARAGARGAAAAEPSHSPLRARLALSSSPSTKLPTPRSPSNSWSAGRG